MAQLKDSLITGDLRVTGTIYGNANLDSLNASGTGLGTNGQILTSTGTGLAWSSSVAPSSHTHGNLTNAGELGAANAAVVTDGNKKITTRTIKNMTAAGNLGWTAAATDIYIPTVNTLAYWNGRYNSSSSNLAYCNKGAFGDAATYGVDDATANGALGNGTGLTTERSVYYGLVTVNNASQTRATGIYAPTGAGTSGQYLKASGGTSAPTWASFTKPSVTWTDGTSNGPTLKITTDGGASDAVAVPSATSSVSGIVTTGSQTFAGDKTFGGTDAFTVKATSIRFQNKAGNTSQALSGSSNGTKYPYVTSLMIGDGREVTLDEYGDGYLGIHSKYGIFIQSNSSDIKEYDATKTYSVGALVWYDRKYYRCTTAISTAEAWTAGHWTAVPNSTGTIVIEGTVQPLVTESKDLGTSTYKWNNLYAKKINGTDIASVTAQTTQAVYPIKINAIGQITGYGSAVTLGTLASKSTISAHSYTPAGSVSVSTSTTENKTATVSTTSGTATYTPGGTNSAPAFTGTAATIVVNGGTGTATYTPAGTIAVNGTTSTATVVKTATFNTVVTSATVANEILTISTGTAGSSTNQTGVRVADPAYKFTGTGTRLTASYTPEGSVAAPTFTGTGVRLVTGNIAVPKTYSASFSGTAATLSHSVS